MTAEQFPKIILWEPFSLVSVMLCLTLPALTLSQTQENDKTADYHRLAAQPRPYTGSVITSLPDYKLVRYFSLQSRRMPAPSNTPRSALTDTTRNILRPVRRHTSQPNFHVQPSLYGSLSEHKKWTRPDCSGSIFFHCSVKLCINLVLIVTVLSLDCH